MKKTRDRVKELIRVKASELRANSANWRAHGDQQKAAMRGILDEVGFVSGLIAVRDKRGKLTLIDGHLRKEISGDELVPVQVVDLTEAEAKKILATFDPIGAMASSNATALESLLAGVKTDSADVTKMLADLMAQANAAKPTPPVHEDEVPAPPKVAKTKPGDLYILGGHRLLCGDSTVEADVERLLNGQRVACVVTDPPYGVSAGAKNRLLNSVQKAGRCLTDIADDNLNPEDLEKRLRPAFELMRTKAMAEDCTVFVFSPQGGGLSMMMMMMMQNAGLKARHVLIWKKNAPTFSMGRLDYDYQHEPILLTWLKKHKRPMGGMHKSSVWEVDKPRASADHPTMKPVELYANAYLNHTDAGDLVYDAYGGSGTALVAAEQTDRRAFVMELDPIYCDVAVARWEKLTGKKAKREAAKGAAKNVRNKLD